MKILSNHNVNTNFDIENTTYRKRWTAGKAEGERKQREKSFKNKLCNGIGLEPRSWKVVRRSFSSIPYRCLVYVCVCEITPLPHPDHYSSTTRRFISFGRIVISFISKVMAARFSDETRTIIWNRLHFIYFSPSYIRTYEGKSFKLYFRQFAKNGLNEGARTTTTTLHRRYKMLRNSRLSNMGRFRGDWRTSSYIRLITVRDFMQTTLKNFSDLP